MYQVIWEKEALDQLDKLDKKVAKELYEKVNLDLANNPQKNPQKGKIKKLYGKWEGFWRYRLGNCRAIYEILEDEVIVSIVKVGLREKVYKKRTFG